MPLRRNSYFDQYSFYSGPLGLPRAHDPIQSARGNGVPLGIRDGTHLVANHFGDEAAAESSAMKLDSGIFYQITLTPTLRRCAPSHVGAIRIFIAFLKLLFIVDSVWHRWPVGTEWQSIHGSKSSTSTNRGCFICRPVSRCGAGRYGPGQYRRWG
jgi:hypothetical protein